VKSVVDPVPLPVGQLVLADVVSNGHQTIIGRAWTRGVVQSGVAIAWTAANARSEVRLTDMRTARTRALNLIPVQLQKTYAAIPQQVVANGTRVLYTVAGGAEFGMPPLPRTATIGGYRYAATDGSFDRRAAPCTTPSYGAKVVGTPFDDWINVRNRSFRFARESVTCGGGRDTVVADLVDVVAKDCERVARR
jgi:hypothetical protein